MPTAGLRGRSAAVSCPGAVFAARCFLLRLSPILSPPVACSGPGNPAHFLVFSSQAPMGPWLETPEPRMASPAVSQAALRALGLGGAARPCQPAARQWCGCWTTASHRPSPAFREPMGVRIATRKKHSGKDAAARTASRDSAPSPGARRCAESLGSHKRTRRRLLLQAAVRQPQKACGHVCPSSGITTLLR